MRRLILKTFLFLFAVIGIGYALVSICSWWPYRNYHPGPKLSRSKIVIMPEDRQYNFVFLGGSHGECLTCGQSYDSVSNDLDTSFFNLSKGKGSGIIPMAMFIDYFYHNHNKGKHFLYFIDSQLFFSDAFNEKPLFLKTEPFDLYMLYLAKKHHIDQGMLIDYFQTKFSFYWLRDMRKEDEYSATLVHDSITRIDTADVRKRIDNMFFEAMDTVRMRYYQSLLLNLVNQINNEGGDITFVIPPTLLGVLPGDIYLQKMLEEWNAKYHIRYIDLSQKMQNLSYYYNLDHLNAKGTDFMMRNYIKPMFDSTAVNNTSQNIAPDAR